MAVGPGDQLFELDPAEWVVEWPSRSVEVELGQVLEVSAAHLATVALQERLGCETHGRKAKHLARVLMMMEERG